MTTRKKLIAGNWKMHGSHAANAELLVAMGAATLQADPQAAGREAALLAADLPRVERMRESIRSARATFDRARVRCVIDELVATAPAVPNAVPTVAV